MRSHVDVSERMAGEDMALLVLCALVAVVEGRNSSLLPLLTAEKNTCLEEALRGIYDALGFPVVDIICEEMGEFPLSLRKVPIY